MTERNDIPVKLSLPIATKRPLEDPTALDCLRCHLIGRRKLACARVDQCKEIPHVSALGPALLAGWLAMLVAFIIAIL
ncbi:MAG TPA: hypothetical protein VFG53_08290 [Anaeromyxobacter sp.]|nr:hypothetical protein [Anaeromyxobacter sp.]